MNNELEYWLGEFKQHPIMFTIVIVFIITSTIGV